MPDFAASWYRYGPTVRSTTACCFSHLPPWCFSSKLLSGSEQELKSNCSPISSSLSAEECADQSCVTSSDAAGDLAETATKNKREIWFTHSECMQSSPQDTQQCVTRLKDSAI